MKQKKPLSFRFAKYLVRLFSPRMEVIGLENLPDEPVILVGNHAQMYGPIACELYLPDHFYTWCAGQMMHLKDVPAYAYQDFWSQKPAWSRPFYKLASYLIAPLSVLVFNNARTIGVYRDTRILSTFRETVNLLKAGNNVVIFPEYDKPYNNIIYDFQENFIEVAKVYGKRTGGMLPFVPLYIAPRLKRMYIGKPIRFSNEAPVQEERRRICNGLMKEITEMAQGLPRHTVIPYRNIPKKQYPVNVPPEVEK